MREKGETRERGWGIGRKEYFLEKEKRELGSGNSSGLKER